MIDWGIVDVVVEAGWVGIASKAMKKWWRRWRLGEEARMMMMIVRGGDDVVDGVAGVAEAVGKVVVVVVVAGVDGGVGLGVDKDD